MYNAEGVCDLRWHGANKYFASGVAGGAQTGSIFEVGLGLAGGNTDPDSNGAGTKKYLTDAQLWYFMWTFAKEVDYTEEHCNHERTVAAPKDKLDEDYSAWVCTHYMGNTVYSVVES